MENNNLHRKCFNRFIDYVNKNISAIEIKFKDNNIILIDKRYTTNISKINWYMLNNNFTIDEMIEYFFLGYDMSNSIKFLSIFEYVEHWFKNCDPDLSNLLKHFGKPSSLEELAIKMDLMGI